MKPRSGEIQTQKILIQIQKKDNAKMKFLTLLLFPILFSCQTEKVSKLTSNVGDIEFDEKLDDKNFKLNIN